MTTRASKRLKIAAEKAVVTATTSVSAETSVETSRKKTVVKAAVSVEKTTTTTTKKGDDSKAAWGALFSKNPKVTADGEKIWPRPKQLPGGLSDEMQEKISAFAAFDGVTKTRTNAAPWKLVAWNVNGLRAVLKKDNTVHLRAYVAQEDPDVLCLSETKIDSEELQKLEDVLPQYEHQYWSSAAKKGYSGTVVFSKTKPLSVKDEIVVENGQPDDEGRFLALEFETFWLVHTYVPNAGQKLERLSYRTEQWDKAMLKMLKELEETKPVVWCGDLNVAHQEIDIHNPKGNKKSAGFTNEERESFSEILENGFVDSFRHFNPDKVQYSYWGYRFNARAQNKGWRLDYFIISKSLLERVESTFVRDSVTGSDHCPVGIELK